ncbi:MAG: thioesterase [Isosphaera sp.]|nr:thioesterase [Isosphaera sp.]
MRETAADDGFEPRVRASFARQRVMETIGAALTRVEAGAVEIALPYRADLTQQHGFVHAGIVATILDSACGYAAFSLMPADVAVLTVEYKINLLRPATGDHLVARARVVRSGKTLTVCAGDVVSQTGGAEAVVATMLATVMAVPQRDDLRQ